MQLHQELELRHRIAAAGALGLTLLIAWPLARLALAPGVPDPTATAREHASRVRILRDGFGVPHVFGERDVDAAFGLAYAHSEDDWPLIQGVMAASRGQLGRVMPGTRSLANDYYAGFVDVDGELDRTWPGLAPDMKALLEAYAEGLNHYAADHPEEVDARLLPFTGQDIGRAFIHKLPLMMKVDRLLKALGEGEHDVGEHLFPGSNAQAVSRERSTDDVTRLNINAHQPWSGPVTFYEAHVHSEEGWNASGALFPGAPMILVGHNDEVGWAMTVNRPDGADVYALDIEGDTYRFDGAQKPLVSRSHWLPLETPWATLWIPQTIRESVHGPVFEKGARPYAIATPARDQGLRAAEQWFRMNKATSVEAFEQALTLNAIPMFNLTYAGRDHIGFVYNARIPDRKPGHDYQAVLPGDTSSAVWDQMLPFEALPAVRDPASGFVQACNSTPWRASAPDDAPHPTVALADAGIETVVTNRTHRTLELLDGTGPVSRQDFLDLKWDPGVSARSPMALTLLEPLAQTTYENPDQEAIRRALLAWDRRFVPDSVGAALATLVWRPLLSTGDNVQPGWVLDEAMALAAAHLREHHGRLDLTLGELQRLHRGSADLPLAGGPDVLHCTYSQVEGAHLVGNNGDGFVMVVEFTADGVHSSSIHQFGSATARLDNPHHADQAPLFVDRQLKPVLRDEASIRRFLEAEYRPGEAWTPVAGEPFALLRRARAADSQHPDHQPAP